MDLRQDRGRFSPEPDLSERIEAAAAQWEERRGDLTLAELGSLAPPPGDLQRTAVLIELIKIDQEDRWSRGERPVLEDYLEHLPELASDEATLLELLVAECMTRGSFGRLPSGDDLQKRFPDVADRIDLEEIEAKLAAEDSPAMGLLDATGNGDTPPKAFDATSVRPKAPSPLKSGQTFGPEGRYEIIEELGHGGMATVYLALDTLLQRKLAIKVLHLAPEKGATGEGDEGMKRWLSEAQMSARLRDHPNLCQVYDAGQWEGLSYIALEWIEGESLDKKLARGEISPREVARLTCKLARVLEEVHAAGVVHRDLKPSNVMINHKGEPVLLDFGISKLLEPAATAPDVETSDAKGRIPVRFTGYSQLPGTLPWMAPEQLLGKVDSQSDVYSLGVMLFQMLTGKLPHTSPTLATQTELHRLVDDILHADPGGPELQNPEVDPVLAKICRKAMAKSVKSRYSSVGAMADALESYLEAETRAASGGRRRFVGVRTLVALAFVAFFVVAVVVIMKTGEGTVVVVVDERGADVTVNGSRVEIKDGKATSVVKVGESVVEVSREGREAVKEAVRVRWRGERVVVRLPLKDADTKTAADLPSGRVHHDRNAIWNNKVYISWQNATAQGQPDSKNMVVDTWRVDDDGDGDPRNDLNRIQPGAGSTNGLVVNLGQLGTGFSGAKAETVLNADGSASVALKRRTNEGEIEAVYTIRPDDANIYGKVEASPLVDSSFNWGIDQVCGVRTKNMIGAMKAYNRLYIDGRIRKAEASAARETGKEGRDFWTIPAGPGKYMSLISTEYNWMTGMIVTRVPPNLQLIGVLRMSSEFGGWGFNRSLLIATAQDEPLIGGKVYHFEAVFHADSDLSRQGFEKLLAE